LENPTVGTGSVDAEKPPFDPGSEDLKAAGLGIEYGRAYESLDNHGKDGKPML